MSGELDTALNNPDAKQGGLLPVVNTVDASQWFSGASGSTGGTCPQDVSIQLGGSFNTAINLPISQFCDRFDLIRLFVLVGASLTALYISIGTMRE